MDKLKDNLSGKATVVRKIQALATNLFYHFCALVIRLILCINGGFHVEGKDNIPTEGGIIIASNHLSYLDPLLLGAVVPRRAAFMARKGLFGLPLLGWFIKHYAFPVDRERTRPSTIKEAVRRLKNGEAIVMFPEGRRSETGELLKAKRGVGMIASLSKAVVIPTLVIGTNNALPFNAKWLKRVKVSVIFGKPVEFSEGQGDNIYEDTSQKIMYAIGELKKRYADKSG